MYDVYTFFVSIGYNLNLVSLFYECFIFVLLIMAFMTRKLGNKIIIL